MQLSRRFLHDKWVLILLSINIFLAIVCVLLVLLRFGADGGGSDYIVQYRANLGISAFKTGSLLSILSFAAYAVVVTVINIMLSMRMYNLRRQLSLATLGLGALLLIFALIVSNALLGLR